MKFVSIEQKQTKNVETIRGFMPFSPGSIVTGVLHKAILKGERQGFYLVKLIEPCTINIDVRRAENAGNTTGQGIGNVGDLVGIRAVHATRYFRDPAMLGKTVRVEFLQTEERTGNDNQKFLYHKMDVQVAEETN